MILLALERTFDKFCHEFLVTKLKAAAIGLSIIKNFLLGRNLVARIFGSCAVPHFSLSRTDLNGAPQGSILGPSLFNFYLSNVQNSSIKPPCA